MTRLIYFVAILTIVGCAIKKDIAKTQKNFTGQELADLKSESPNMPMRVFKTTNYTDSLLLRKDSEPAIVNPNDKGLQHFVDRLYATVRDSISLGVGIAAPQVGVLKDIIWVQRFDKEGFPFEVYLNPVIKQYSTKKQDCKEGCLSIPDRSETTKSRAYAILLEYDKMDGTHVTEMVEDFTAVIFQHEIDHLHGILFLDRLEE